MIKLLFLSLSLCFANSLPWKIQEKAEDSFAVATDGSGLEIKLEQAGGPQKILNWKASPKNPGIYVLEYEAGSAGTHSIYRIKRGAVVHVATKKVLADLPLQYVPQDKKTKPLPQPKWKWESKHLSVKDKAFGESKELKLE